MARASMMHQVILAFKFMDRINNKKNTLRRNYIYHGKTMKTYIGLCGTFVKWAKDKYGIKYLAELDQDMGRDYLKYMMEKGCSAYTMAVTRSALRKLEKAVARKFHHGIHIVPPDIEIPQRKLKYRIERYAFSEEQAESIIICAAEIDNMAATALSLQKSLGFRISEVLNLRVKDIDFTRRMAIVWRGKGGRLREIPIDDQETFNILFKICFGKIEDHLLFPEITTRKLERIMKKACEKAGVKGSKTHNLRHTYAVRQFKKKLAEGKPDKEARREVSKLMGHNRIDVTYSYVPRWVNKV